MYGIYNVYTFCSSYKKVWSQRAFFTLLLCVSSKNVRKWRKWNEPLATERSKKIAILNSNWALLLKCVSVCVCIFRGLIKLYIFSDNRPSYHYDDKIYLPLMSVGLLFLSSCAHFYQLFLYIDACTFPDISIQFDFLFRVYWPQHLIFIYLHVSTFDLAYILFHHGS